MDGEDKWAFLAPWWGSLQTHELVVRTRHHDFREELHALSVSTDPRSNYSYGQRGFREPTTEEKIQSFYSLRDALELVLLLAIVDPSAFNDVVSANVDAPGVDDASLDTLCVLEFHEGKPPSRVELRFRRHCSNDADKVDLMFDALRVFITQMPLHEREAVFQDARRRRLEQIPPSETDKRAACESLKVSVNVINDGTIMPSSLLELLDSSLAAATTDYKSIVYPFVAGGFQLTISQRTFTPNTSTQFASWLENDKTYPYDRVRISYEDWLSLKRFGRALSVALQPQHIGGAATSPRYVDVTVSEMADPVRFAQICSALMHTQRMQSLTISLYLRERATDHERRLHLRWFVFTVWSRWATHNLKHIRVHKIKLTDEELEDLLQFLRCENPLPLLFSESDSDEAEMANVPAKQVLAREGAEVELDLPPTRLTDGERESVQLSQETWLDVVSEDTQDEGGWVVLVPVYGKCRLRHVDTLQVRLTEVSGPFINERVTSLGVYGTTLRKEKGQGLAGFLRCVGRPLEILRLRYLDGEEGGTLTEVLASCHSLKRLDLPDSNSKVLPHLIKAYETGVCKAATLNLGLMSHRPTVLQFFESLADPTQRISQTVRELIFSYGAFGPHIPVNEVAAMREMLENNHTMQYFERRCEPVHNDAFVDLCHEYNNARHKTTTPLDSQSKCAFLSCVWSNTSSILPRTQLDNVMVSRIFEMAAEPVVRRAIVGSFRQILRD